MLSFFLCWQAFFFFWHLMSDFSACLLPLSGPEELHPGTYGAVEKSTVTSSEFWHRLGTQAFIPVTSLITLSPPDNTCRAQILEKARLSLKCNAELFTSDSPLVIWLLPYADNLKQQETMSKIVCF